MKYFKQYIITILLVLPLTLNLFGQKYVKTTATGNGSGSSWDNALGLSGLKAAIEAGGTIYIASGTYNISSVIGVNAIYLSLPGGIGSTIIQGGFPLNATGTDISGYNPTANPTIMDGGGLDKGFLFQNGPGASLKIQGLFIQNFNKGGDGSGIYCAGGSASAYTLEFTDLTIKNCGKAGIGAGCGVYLTSLTHPSLVIRFKNCLFDGNLSGEAAAIRATTVYNNISGVITNNTGNFSIDGCRFVNNKTSSVGGAIVLTTSHGWNITNSCFTGNTSGVDGGALYTTTSSNNKYSGCNFTDNTATANGGSIYMTTSIGNEYSNCNFINNTAGTYGGACVMTTASGIYNNVLFANNTCGTNYYGGAIFATTATVTLNTSTFSTNKGGAGGAIYSTTWYAGNRSSATNCIFYNNEATNTTWSTTGTNGGGALCINANANGWDFKGTSFVGNKVPAVGWGGAISHYDAETTIDNCLFYNNTKGTDATISGSDIKNYDNAGHFNSIINSKMQLASNSSYTNQAGGTDATSYGFGTGVTFNNTSDGGVVVTLPTISCPASIASTAINFNGNIQPQSAPVNTSQSGDASTQLAPSGGLAPYTYSNGSNDAGCIAPQGALVLPASSNLVIQSNGAYSYTTPSTPGTYYFCIKVCDSSSPSICKVAVYTVNVTAASSNGTLDCSKTILVPAPIVGVASMIILKVTINVTTSGTFPVSVSGSGMTLLSGVSSVQTTNTGTQTLDIPLKYDGTALGVLTFTVGTNTCTADLSSVTAKKKAIVDVWALDNCSIKIASPSLK